MLFGFSSLFLVLLMLRKCQQQFFTVQMLSFFFLLVIFIYFSCCCWCLYLIQIVEHFIEKVLRATLWLLTLCCSTVCAVEIGGGANHILHILNMKFSTTVFAKGNFIYCSQQVPQAEH